MNNEVFKIVGSVLLKDEEFIKGLKNIANEGEKTSSKLSKVFSGIGKTAVAFGKVVASGTAVATAGLVAITKQAIDAYADYEQLVGGVETLFKKNADKVLDYANNAYKTAGMSANQYMETVTSFSASLLQSLNGDTAEASKVADMAITDMSDNANKMGTSIESIQVAYQGFAKQNYTMLDNLKLGYGGTKEEMERLLADAEKLSGKKYDIKNLNDVYEAIHVVQTELGITGTTAKEASSTISGSLASMKASWQNLLVGVADDTADFETLINNFVESVGTFGENIIPRIEIAVDGAVQLVVKLFPMLVEALGSLAERLAPKLASAVSSLLVAIINILPQLTQSVVDILILLADEIMNNMPLIIDAIQELIVQILRGVAEIAPKLVTMLIEMIPLLLDAILVVGMEIINLLPTLITDIVQALVDGLPLIIDGAIKFFMGIIDAIPVIIQKLVPILPDIITTIIEALINGIDALLDGAVQLLTAIVDAIPIIIDALVPEIPGIVSTIVETLIENLPTLLDGAIELFMALVEAIPTIIKELIKCGPDIIVGLIKGITDAIFNIDWGAVWDGIIQSFKNLFGINSPSTLFAEFGGYLIEGLKNGLANIGEIIGGIFSGLKDTIVEKWNNIKDSISEKASQIKESVSNKFNELKDKASEKFSSMKTAVSNKVNELKDGAVNKFNDLKSKASEKFSSIKESVTEKVSSLKTSAVNKFNELKDGISGKIESLKTSASNKFNSIKDSISNKLSSAKTKATDIFQSMNSATNGKLGTLVTNVKNKFGNVYDGIKGKMEDAKKKVSDIVGNMTTSFKNFAPKLKMPHIKIKGEWDLKALKFPSFNVDWYAKGGIFSKPTIFGTNSGFKGVGEAGPEAVAPISELMDYTRLAVDESNSGLADKLDVLINILTSYLPLLADRQLVLSTGELVGALVDPMDKALGDKANDRRRGR